MDVNGNEDYGVGHAGNSLSNTMPEQRSDYVNRPEGEMDMLIGFFLMNGFCVFFFLLFGLCVIFSCLRRRPKMFRRPKQPSPPLIESQPARKTTSNFKALVNRAMKNADFASIANGSQENAGAHKKETSVIAEGEQVQIHVLDDSSARSSRKNSRRSSKIQIESEISEAPPPKSVVRENLLGPLTFDDLYYT